MPWTEERLGAQSATAQDDADTNLDCRDRRDDDDDAQRVRDLWPALMATWQGE